MKTTLAYIGGAALGVGFMYLADPRAGKRRRAVARDGAVHGAKVLARALDISSRDTAHRLRGVYEETKRLFKQEVIDRLEPYTPGENMPTQASRERQLDILQ